MRNLVAVYEGAGFEEELGAAKMKSLKKRSQSLRRLQMGRLRYQGEFKGSRMRSLIVALVALSLALMTPVPSRAETIIPSRDDFFFRPYPIEGETSTADARFDDASNSFILTEAKTYYSNVRNMMKLGYPICAKNYAVSFEANLGTVLTGGAGITVENYFDEALTDFMVSSELDTYQDMVSDPNGSVFEPNNNHIDIVSLLGTLGASPWTPRMHAAVAKMPYPFRLAGAGWVKYQLVNNHGAITVILRDAAGNLIAQTSAQAEYRENAPFWLAFTGSTRSGSKYVNLQRVRNIKVDVLESCDLPEQPTLSRMAALAVVDPDNALETCPIDEAQLTEFMGRLKGLHDARSVNEETFAEIMSTVQAKTSFCTGLNACRADLDSSAKTSYENGLRDGAASVDLEAACYDKSLSARQDGYNKGYEQGQADIYFTAYSEGTREGVRIGYEQGKNDGFAAGRDEGYYTGSAEGFKQGREVGYQEGDLAGYDRGLTIGFTDGRALGFELGQVDGFNSGYAAGQASGYSSGFTDGVSSVPACPISDNSGVSASPATLPVEKAQELVKLTCSCATSKTSGRYVSCVTKASNALLQGGFIVKEVRDELHANAVKANCSKVNAKVVKK